MSLPDAMAKLQSLYGATPQPLVTEALLLCAGGSVTERDGTYTIRYGKDGDEEVATVEAGACDCDPLATERQVCAHVLAASLYELLQEQEKPPPLDSPLLERHIEKIVSGAVMTEAPYSASVTVQDADGYDFILTVRKQDGREFFEAITGLRGWIKKQGFTPKQWRAPAQEVAREVRTERRNEEPEPLASSQKTYLFHAETLLRSELGGKYIWAVMGADIPAYNKRYGMRIWNEVLEEAGFDVGALEGVRIADLPNLKGYIAEYIMKDDDPKKPDKITRLRKG